MIYHTLSQNPLESSNPYPCLIQAADVLHDMEYLFERGGLFLPEAAKDSVTQMVFRSLKDIGVVKFLGSRHPGARGDRPERAASVWDPSGGDLTKSKEVAVKIYRVFKAYFDSNFPAHEYANCFACLDLANGLSLEQRGKLVRAIAKQNSLDPEATWNPGLHSISVVSKSLNP